MAKHTFKMSDVTGDTRVLARSALGYDFNYYADDETIIFGTDSDATLSWDGDSLNVTSSATEVSGTLATAGATSLATTAQMTVGTGISAVANAIVKHSVVTVGNIIETTIILDLTGLNSGNADGDVIGKADTANCHYGQITAATNRTILSGYVQCLETPAGGEPDIDLYSNTVATLTEDAAHNASGSSTALLAAAADWTNLLAPKGLTTVPPADGYLYLVASGGATNDTYTAGKFVIKLYGYAA